MHRRTSLAHRTTIVILLVGLLLPLSAGSILAQDGGDAPPPAAQSAGADSDGDLIGDAVDNCPSVRNTAQIDWDADGIGDDCDITPRGEDTDADDDLIDDANDNCLSIANTAQLDWDGDGVGNECDDTPDGVNTDADDDLIDDSVDNCPAIANTAQLDWDGDGTGNACDDTPEGVDTDADDDLIEDAVDNCPTVPNTAQIDMDNDGTGDACASSMPGGELPGGELPGAEPGGLTISTTPDNGTVVAEDPMSFTVTVTNTGSTTSADLTVGDVLPTTAGLVWTLGTHTFDFCEITSGELFCASAGLNAGASETVTVTSPTTRASCGTIATTATLSGDAVSSPVSDAGSIEVQCPNVKLSAAADAAQVTAGQTVGVTISVTNYATEASGQLNISASLPTGAGVTWTIDPAQAACTVSNGTTLSCAGVTLAPSGSAGDTLSVHLTSATVLPPPGQCAEVVLQTNATLTGAASGSGSATTNVVCPTGVVFFMTPANGTVERGQDIEFTFTVANYGSSTPSVSVGAAQFIPSNSGISWSMVSNTACYVNGPVVSCGNVPLVPGTSWQTVYRGTGTGSVSCNEVITIARFVSVQNVRSGNAVGNVTVTCPGATDLSSSSTVAVVPASGAPIVRSRRRGGT